SSRWNATHRSRSPRRRSRTRARPRPSCADSGSNCTAPCRTRPTDRCGNGSIPRTRPSPRTVDEPRQATQRVGRHRAPMPPCSTRRATLFHRMLNIDLTGKRALVAGVADDGGYGFAIAKSLADAGASVVVGTWPPALNIFLTLLERGKIDESRRLSDGRLLEFERIYPLDAAYDTLADAPDDVRNSKRYRETGDFSIAGLAQRLTSDFGDRPLDILVHSLANGPEVKKPLLEVSRAGYLTAVSVSAYSLIGMVQRL